MKCTWRNVPKDYYPGTSCKDISKRKILELLKKMGQGKRNVPKDYYPGTSCKDISKRKILELLKKMGQGMLVMFKRNMRVCSPT
ncbi:hypothetical protein QE152_g9058 [Popillia japonica]|uniref:Uncharacterized protein n=1 Tax=Popillia japonica TaxID=7064 RepID=A0AAW1LZG6_POPJA